MANFPMDIITDLFLRLPASTLVRFRVLSKPCFSLIDSPDFIASHLNRTLLTGDHLMILLRGPRFLRTVGLDAPDKVSDVEHSLQSSGLTEVFGSCNGLIGLTNSPTDMALFNPSTRKIHRLPAEPVDFRKGSFTQKDVFYGLGYDSVNKDYKVVRIVQCNERKTGEGVFRFPCELKVYSLKRNSWKSIGLLFETQLLFIYFYYHLLHRRGYGVLASNCLHWVLPRSQGVIAFNTIFRFDLASEEFGVLQFPQDLYCKKIDIGVLDGCLCLMSHHDFSHVDVWILREYKGSWTKLFSVPTPESVKSFDFFRPLLYSKDRSKILVEINHGKFMWFDLASKRLTTLRIKECDGSDSAELLVSSLVLGCKGDPNEVMHWKERRAGEDEMTKKSKKRDDFLSKGFKLVL